MATPRERLALADLQSALAEVRAQIKSLGELRDTLEAAIRRQSVCQEFECADCGGHSLTAHAQVWDGDEARPDTPPPPPLLEPDTVVKVT